MADKKEPVAWAVYADLFGEDGPAVCRHRDVSERLANEVGGRLVPLWASDFAPEAPDFASQPPDFAEPVASQRPFSLTDAEREAVKRASETLRYLQADYGQTQTEQDAVTLRGLLERMGDFPTPDNVAHRNNGTAGSE